MNIWEMCACDQNQICPFCKILTVVCVAVIAGVAGYFLGKRKK